MTSSFVRTYMTSAETTATHTPPRSIRVPDELWKAAKYLSEVRGETISDILNVALATYVLGGMTQEDRRVTEIDREALARRIPEEEVRRIIRRRTP
jgi:hypothetical protein